MAHQISPRGQAAPSNPFQAPVAPAHPSQPAANNLMNGQPDKVNGGATPAAADQPGSNPGDAEAARMKQLAQDQARAREEQRQRKIAHDRQLQAERDRVATERQAEQRELQALRQKLDRLKTDPYSVMLEQGLTADQAAALMMQQPDVPSQHITLLQQQLADANAKIEKLLTGQTEQQNQSRESARTQIRHDAQAIVQADTGLEAMRLYGDEAVAAVVALVEKTFDEDGFVMDTAKAIEEVEEYLIEQSLRGAQLGKVKTRLFPAPADPAQPPAAQAQAGALKQKIPTLSSAMTPTTQSNLTPSQRRERAILAFQGKLT